jgi:cell division protein FtsB
MVKHVMKEESVKMEIVVLEHVVMVVHVCLVCRITVILLVKYLVVEMDTQILMG